MKHKHAELIKAWADGAQIQRATYVYPDFDSAVWRDDPQPCWDVNYTYRIKPADIVRALYVQLLGTRGLVFEYAACSPRLNSQLLCLTFDGETKQLKSAEVIK